MSQVKKGAFLTTIMFFSPPLLGSHQRRKEHQRRRHASGKITKGILIMLCHFLCRLTSVAGCAHTNNTPSTGKFPLFFLKHLVVFSGSAGFFQRQRKEKRWQHSVTQNNLALKTNINIPAAHSVKRSFASSARQPFLRAVSFVCGTSSLSLFTSP